jgi:hypothetical protein
VEAVWVKESLHPVFHLGRYVLEPRMVDPVLRGILSERKFVEVISGNVFVEV